MANEETPKKIVKKTKKNASKKTPLEKLPAEAQAVTDKNKGLVAVKFLQNWTCRKKGEEVEIDAQKAKLLASNCILEII